jgi:hypothetical protein
MLVVASFRIDKYSVCNTGGVIDQASNNETCNYDNQRGVNPFQ